MLDFSPKAQFLEFKGEVSGQIFNGDFEILPILGIYQRSLANQDYRAFLGSPKEGEALPEELQNLALMLSQLKFRVVKAPSWYNDSNGLRSNFVDINVIYELFDVVLKVEKDWRDSLIKKAEDAKVALMTPANVSTTKTA